MILKQFRFIYLIKIGQDCNVNVIMKLKHYSLVTMSIGLSNNKKNYSPNHARILTITHNKVLIKFNENIKKTYGVHTN